MRPWCSARAAPSPPELAAERDSQVPGCGGRRWGSVFPCRSVTPSQSNAGAGLRLSAIRHNTAGVTDRKRGPKPYGAGVVTDVTDRSPDLWRPAPAGGSRTSEPDRSQGLALRRAVWMGGGSPPVPPSAAGGRRAGAGRGFVAHAAGRRRRGRSRSLRRPVGPYAGPVKAPGKDEAVSTGIAEATCEPAGGCRLLGSGSLGVQLGRLRRPLLRSMQPQQKPRAGCRAASSQPAAASSSASFSPLPAADARWASSVPRRTRARAATRPSGAATARPKPHSTCLPCSAPWLRSPRPRQTLSPCAARALVRTSTPSPVRSLPPPGRPSPPDRYSVLRTRWNPRRSAALYTARRECGFGPAPSVTCGAYRCTRARSLLLRRDL
jgi:hypothetical protein